MKSLFFLSSLLFSILSVNGQYTSLYGKVTDEESGEELLYVNIVLTKNGVFATGGSTDFEGNYSVDVDPGTYDMKVTYTGYPDIIIKSINIISGQLKNLDILLSQQANSLNIVIVDGRVPIIKPDTTYSGNWNYEQKRIIIFNSVIYGKITDEETGEELLYANIVLNKNGVLATGGSTNFEGNYSIPVDPGTYELKISYTGYPDRIIKDIIIKAEEATKLDIAMMQGVDIIIVHPISCYLPLLDQEPSSSGQTIYQEEIRDQSTKEINQILLNAPGVSINNF